MEKKFGVFKTVDELIRAAEAQKKEGDLDALVALAKENGLDREDAEDYFDDLYDEFCTPKTAAIAKINMEAEELQLKSQLKDWKDIIITLIVGSTDYKLAEAAFDPDKHLVDVLGLALKEASKNRVKVDERIIKAAGLPTSAAQIGMCGRDELKRIVREYYLGGSAK